MPAGNQTALVTVVHAGLLSCLQDFGRPGFRHLGVSAGGAADRASLQLTRRLLGNGAVEGAALEIWQSGLHLQFHSAARIALFGADADIDCDGSPLPLGCPIELPAKAQLKIRRVSTGNLLYLCVDGGWQAEQRLGSMATDLRAGFGGYQGRPLTKADRLHLACPPSQPLPEALRIARYPAWRLAPPATLASPGTVLRILPAPGHSHQVADLVNQSWQVASDSNRQGLRLQSGQLRAPDAGTLLSRAVLPGSIQLPASGLPIVLGVDAQTIGGYPVLGQVIAADLDLIAQARPLSELRFQAVDEQQALEAWRRRQAELARAEMAIEQHLLAWRRGPRPRR